MAIRSVAIQGERGSNSHMAALEMLGDVEIVPCMLSAQVLDAVVSGAVDAAVLPIENSLHGSVAEHYDLLLEAPVRIDAESQMRIRHNVIAAPGVTLADLKAILSHPVALSQCRRWLAANAGLRATPFYDTAGSVKHLMQEGLRDVAAIAPALAAKEYGAQVLVESIEDHHENFTRFHLLRRDDCPSEVHAVDKLSVAFIVEHRPGTLVAALQKLAAAGADLTKIESRPVPGKPWEYVFYVDFRFDGEDRANGALNALRSECRVVKELGRYQGAKK
jgi:prephenate dehydratase